MTDTPTRSYKDVFRRSERQRPDGSPVWPLRVSDIPSLVGKGK